MVRSGFRGWIGDRPLPALEAQVQLAHYFKLNGKIEEEYMSDHDGLNQMSVGPYAH